MLKRISPAPRSEEELRLLRQPDSGQLQAGPAPERQEPLPLQGDVMEGPGELRTVMQPASPPHLKLRVRVASFRVKGFQQYLTSGRPRASKSRGHADFEAKSRYEAEMTKIRYSSTNNVIQASQEYTVLLWYVQKYVLISATYCTMCRLVKELSICKHGNGGRILSSPSIISLK